MAYKESSQSCTVYQSWSYGQTGGSAGGSKYCTGSMTVTVYQRWAWDGDMWVTSGDRIDSSPGIMNYGPDSEGYSGQLNRLSVSGSPLKPGNSGSYIGQEIQTQVSGTASYGATLTKSDTRTYGWSTSGSLTSDAPSSVHYDDGTYAGTLYLYSVTGSPPTPSGTGPTATTSASGTAYYSGDIPLKPVDDGGNGAGITSVNVNKTSARAVINNLKYAANTYGYFEVELWNGAETEFYYTRQWTDSTSQNYSYYDFSGLAQGKSYKFKAWVRTPGGTRTYIGSHIFTTLTDPLPGGVGTISTIEGITTIDVAWSHATDASRYAIEVRLGSSSGSIVYNRYDLLTVSENISGLLGNTTYHIKVYAINNIGNGTPSEKTVTTKSPSSVPSTPTNFKVSSQDAISVNLTWDIVSNATSYSIEVYIKGTTTNPVSQDYGITTNTKFITGLTTGQSYDIKLWAVNTGGNSAPTWLYDVKPGGARPSNWSWVSLTNSGTLYLDGKILRSNIVRAPEWNDFCKRINEFRVYKLGAGKEYTFTAAIPKKGLSPTIFTQVTTAINAMNPPTPVPNTVITGQLGVYMKLIALKDSLNSIK